MYHSRKPNVGYSSTSKAYRVFNRSTLTIEESMHVKFEESNVVVENVVEFDSLGAVSYTHLTLPTIYSV